MSTTYDLNTFFFHTDLTEMYSSEALDPELNVRTLQHKVMFDIRYYFARRGGEKIPNMMKDTFKMMTDVDTGLNYIMKQKDEETKNHKLCDKNITTAFMPELKNNKLCPVQSFLPCIYSLSPESNFLW